MKASMSNGLDVFYNEWDATTSRWLAQLTRQGELPTGKIDARSITEIKAEEIKSYAQCHFFAGIGGWPLALRWAGLEHTPRIWTGSPPCQPFSNAGKREGKSDERHLLPAWLDLIKSCRPRLIFGEQVASAIGHGWLDDLCDVLEGEGYTCGAAVLPACSVGAPHLRYRLFFGAVARRGGIRSISSIHHAKHGRPLHSVADSNRSGLQGRHGNAQCYKQQFIGSGSLEGGSTEPDHDIWSGADWLGCRDGKFRPVEPGTQPLADGLPKGVVRSRISSLEEYPSAAGAMRLKGYGNAIVPQVATAFIRRFIHDHDATFLTTPPRRGSCKRI